MTPKEKAKEKAKELIDKYYSLIRLPYDCESCQMCIDVCGNNVEVAKKYSLIAVDEIIKYREEIAEGLRYFYNDIQITIKQEFWNEVKKEIELL